MTPLRICVVGGGLAGLACALAAATAGAQVQLIESSRGSVPAAHIEVVPSLMRDLVSLGAGEACVRAGFPFRRTTLMDRAGRNLFAIDAQPLAGARFPATLGIAWADLKRLLRESVLAAGCQVSSGVRATGASPAGRVSCDDGAVLDADLVLLACGAHSGLRASALGAPQYGAPDQAMHFFLAPRLGLDEAVLAIARDGRKAHVVPVNATLAGIRVRSPSQGQQTPSQLLAGFGGFLPQTVQQTPVHTPTWVRAERAELEPGPWHRGAVLAVGDCAYCLPTHFGQFTAQPVEDAVVLKDLIARCTPASDIPDVFTRRRRERVAQVLELTALASRWDAGPEAATDWPGLTRALAHIVHQPA